MLTLLYKKSTSNPLGEVIDVRLCQITRRILERFRIILLLSFFVRFLFVCLSPTLFFGLSPYLFSSGYVTMPGWEFSKRRFLNKPKTKPNRFTSAKLRILLKALRPNFFLQDRLIKNVVYFAEQWIGSFFKHFWGKSLPLFGSARWPPNSFSPKRPPSHVFFPRKGPLLNPCMTHESIFSPPPCLPVAWIRKQRSGKGWINRIITRTVMIHRPSHKRVNRNLHSACPFMAVAIYLNKSKSCNNNSKNILGVTCPFHLRKEKTLFQTGVFDPGCLPHESGLLFKGDFPDSPSFPRDLQDSSYGFFLRLD